jgi:predicted PurR-regulated permease PerM
MKKQYLSITLFLVVAGAIIFLFYKLLAPFFVPLMWATVFAILFNSVYRRTLARVKKPGLASLLVCLMILILIIGPMTFLSIALFEQAASAVQHINEMRASGEIDRVWSQAAPWWNEIVDRLSPYVDLRMLDLRSVFEGAVNWLGGFFVDQGTWLIGNITKAVFYFLLMLFTLYYFFKEGSQIIERIRRIMPLDPARTDSMFSELRGVINATMISGVVIALIQGFLGGLIFWIVGIKSALFWGAVMALLSIIPLLGAFIIYLPAGIILMISGEPTKGLIIILFGSVVVSQVDNFLRPYMVAGGTRMHPLMLFLSMTGGIALFGLVGIIVGPLIAAAFVTILEVFEFEISSTEEPPTDSG